MRVVVGADHAGVELKRLILERLHDEGYEVIDVGTHDTEPVDYPDFALAVATLILEGKAHRGILFCGSGVGAAIAAGKIPGIRAAVCHDAYTARQGVEHDAMNVLVLGGRVIGFEPAWVVVRTFLSSRFSGEDRHRRRLAKIYEIEKRWNDWDVQKVRNLWLMLEEWGKE